MAKEIYMIHHAQRTNEPNPSHGEWGRSQLHIAKNIIQGLYYKSLFAGSSMTPMPQVALIIHGSGKRFRETAAVIMNEDEFKNASVIEKEFLGNEDAVFEKDGKQFVLTGSGEIFPREEYELIPDRNGIQEFAWSYIGAVNDILLPNTCAIFCTGRQFLTALGLSKEMIKNGCLFKVENIENREVLRIMGY